jgi:hypothetical protein
MSYKGDNLLLTFTTMLTVVDSGTMPASDTTNTFNVVVSDAGIVPLSTTVSIVVNVNSKLSPL